VNSDGVVSAIAGGLNIGAVQVSVISTELTTTPSAKVDVRSGARLTAVRTMEILSLSEFRANAEATGGGGGLISVGSSETVLTALPSSQVTIGEGASLRATGDGGSVLGDLIVTSHSKGNASATGEGVGGGLVSTVAADVTANVSYRSIVDIRPQAILFSTGVLTVESLSELTASTVSDLVAGGGIAVAVNTTSLNVGSSSDPAVTRTNVASNALLQGGVVTVGARVLDFNANNTSTEEADGLGSGATANALTTIHNRTDVILRSDSVVTGDTVTIRSSHAGVSLASTAEATAYAVVGIPNAEAKIDYQSLARVRTEPNSLVSGGTVNVQASQDVQSFQRVAREFAWQNGSGGDDGDRTGSLNAQRSIEWDGDLSVLSTPNPRLVIDENGVIIAAVNATANGLSQGGTITTSQINVDPIINNSNPANAITFNVSNRQTVGGAISPAGSIIGNQATVSVATAFRSVEITNRSNKDLIINGIQVVNPNTQPTIRLNAEDIQGFDFEVGGAIPPTDITVRNLGTSGNVILNAPSGNLVPGSSNLGFSIYNPIGSTQIESAGGSLRNAPSSSRTPTVWTRALDVDVQGGVGSSSSRIDVDLVLPFAQTDLNVDAGADVFMDLTGRLRSDSFPVAEFQGGAITTAGNIDLLFQPSVVETTPQSNAGNASVRLIVNNGSPSTVTSNNAPRDARFFPDYSASTGLNATFRFEQLTTGATQGTLRIAGANTATTAPLVGVQSGTDIGSIGELFASLNGSILLTERTGDLRIRSVSSSAGDVELGTTGTNGSIYDLAVETMTIGTTPWVSGNSVTLSSRDGAIGSPGDFLEINSGVQAVGAVRALAMDGLYLAETAGDLRVDQALSRVNDVVLVAAAGSILEAERQSDRVSRRGKRATAQ
nr:hypothetical protein [Pirellula sp.]